MTAPPKLIISLESNDNIVIDQIYEDVAYKSEILKKMIGDLGYKQENLNQPISITCVNGHILCEIISWCEAHVNSIYIPKEKNEDKTIILSAEEKRFFGRFNWGNLQSLLKGARYLQIDQLIVQIYQVIADKADDCRSVEDIRELFCKNDDLSVDEKAKIEKQYRWVHK